MCAVPPQAHRAYGFAAISRCRKCYPRLPRQSQLRETPRRVNGIWMEFGWPPSRQRDAALVRWIRLGFLGAWLFRCEGPR